MRMPRVHFRYEGTRDILRTERAAPFGHDRMKKYLQHQIAEFIAQYGVVALRDGIIDFVRLLDQIRSQ